MFITVGSESVWEEGFQKRKGWAGKKEGERKNKRRGIKRKEQSMK